MHTLIQFFLITSIIVGILAIIAFILIFALFYYNAGTIKKLREDGFYD